MRFKRIVYDLCSAAYIDLNTSEVYYETFWRLHTINYLVHIVDNLHHFRCGQKMTNQMCLLLC